MPELARFAEAQQTTYDAVLGELRAGRKRSHWVWWIFPQLRGLGHSPNAEHYGIADAQEAREYAADPVLGSRLAECVRLVAAAGEPPEQVLGPVDAMKLRSCLTLFARAADDPQPYVEALATLYGGEPDPATLRMLGEES